MQENKNIYVFAIVLAIVINVFSWHLPFFWDTILTSTITQHFYTFGLGNFISPLQFDAGHPPLFYSYITCFYFLFGKTLCAAHLAILPFTILGIFSFLQILKHFQFDNRQQFFGCLFYFSIPAVCTQNLLVSYDAVLLSLYLTALLAFLKNRKILFSIVLIGIVGISLRGLFCVISLSISFYFLLDRKFKEWIKWNLFFIPAVVLIAAWYAFHYLQTGWLFSTNAAGWSQQRSWANGMQFFKNGIAIARCFFDLGIFCLSILCAVAFFKKQNFDKIFLIAFIPFLLFSISFLPFTNPINHRYFLIVYVLMIPIVLRFLASKKVVFSILSIIILWLGNFQIYPVPISNGWDCTLSHLSYFSCRNHFLEWKEKVHFDTEKMGSVFPMTTSLYQTNFADDTSKMINVNAISIDTFPFILFSNVGNDFSDEQIEQLKSWKPISEWKSGQVNMILYRNPKFQ